MTEEKTEKKECYKSRTVFTDNVTWTKEQVLKLFTDLGEGINVINDTWFDWNDNDEFVMQQYGFDMMQILCSDAYFTSLACKFTKTYKDETQQEEEKEEKEEKETE
eukprot:201314_1